MSTNKLLTLSCSELERQTKINKGCWSRYFKGKFKPSSTNLVKISKALKLSVDEVIDGIEERVSSQG